MSSFSSFRKFLFIACIFCFVLVSITHAQTYKIVGEVIDLENQSPIPFAQVILQGTTIGTTTDLDGQFEINTTQLADSLTIIYLGYEDQNIHIPNPIPFLKIRLKPISNALEEVVVASTRKTKKDTAAITLFRRVIKAKPQRNLAQLDTYQYQEYQKSSFDIYNLKSGFINKKIMKPFDFVYGYADTTASGLVVLPILLREKIKQIYFKREPWKKKVHLLSDQFSGVEDYYKWQLADRAFEEMDIYQNTFNLGGRSFIGPFSDGALMSYKFFLTDSISKEDGMYYLLEFTPKRKGDLCFTGHAWIHKPSAAVESVKLVILEKANLNLVSHFELQQIFKKDSTDFWYKHFEEIKTLISATQNLKHQNIQLTQTTYRDQFIKNQAIPKKHLEGVAFSYDEAAYSRDDQFWETHRKPPLNQKEVGIYEMMDSIKSSKAFRRLDRIGHIAATGYVKTGPVEFGPLHHFFSWNALEGNRFRLGLRTDKLAFKQMARLSAYVAYSDQHRALKYFGRAEFFPRRKNDLWSTFGAHYLYDWSFDYTYNIWWSYDDFFASLFRKTPINNLYLQKSGSLFYEKEWTKGLFQRFQTHYKTFFHWPGYYALEMPNGNILNAGEDRFHSLELTSTLKWSIRAKRQDDRKLDAPVLLKNPYLEINYTYAPKDILKSAFTYHRTQITWSQKLFTFLGQSKWDLSAGKIFGEVPYPLLKIHNGNNSLIYNKWSFSVMNGSEYVSDIWTSLHLRHHFDGLIFNAIPLVKKLKLRSLISTRILGGWLSPTNQNFLSPENSIQALNGFYAEAGFGIENIAKLFRVQCFWRLTQRQLTQGPLFSIQFDFRPRF